MWREGPRVLSHVAKHLLMNICSGASKINYSISTRIHQINQFKVLILLQGTILSLFPCQDLTKLLWIPALLLLLSLLDFPFSALPKWKGKISLSAGRHKGNRYLTLLDQSATVQFKLFFLYLSSLRLPRYLSLSSFVLSAFLCFGFLFFFQFVH